MMRAGYHSCFHMYDEKKIYVKNAEKQNNPNRWIYCDVKSTLNVLVSITIIRTLILGKLFTQRWMLVKITGANKMYATKRYKRACSILNLKVLSTCLTHGKIFENVGFFFFKRQEKYSHLLKKYTELGKFSYIQIVLKSSMIDVM